MSVSLPLLPGVPPFYREMPKIDLHRHLEGSLRLTTLQEIADQHGIRLPQGNLRARVQMRPDDPFNYSTFLSKFQILRQFYRSAAVIERVTHEAIADAAQDGVAYLELRFTPAALARPQDFSLAQVMDWVIGSCAEASQQYHLPTRLIASVNRHEPLALAEEVTRLAVERIPRGIVGMDLAGDEANYPAQPFASIFCKARLQGLRITIHAGEWGSAQNIRTAILQLGAERIGHGVRILEDPAVVHLARERAVVLEVCLTSNLHSGVVPTLASHPLPSLIQSGLKITLNTDDPSISDITLSGEYRLAVEALGLSPAALAECLYTSARASFLPSSEAARLENELRRQEPGSGQIS